MIIRRNAVAPFKRLAVDFDNLTRDCLISERTETHVMIGTWTKIVNACHSECASKRWNTGGKSNTSREPARAMKITEPWISWAYLLWCALQNIRGTTSHRITVIRAAKRILFSLWSLFCIPCATIGIR